MDVLTIGILAISADHERAKNGVRVSVPTEIYQYLNDGYKEKESWTVEKHTYTARRSGDVRTPHHPLLQLMEAIKTCTFSCFSMITPNEEHLCSYYDVTSQLILKSDR